jgi:hypothetical protein
MDRAALLFQKFSQSRLQKENDEYVDKIQSEMDEIVEVKRVLINSRREQLAAERALRDAENKRKNGKAAPPIPEQ